MAAEAPQRDIEKAKKLLAQAGDADGLKFDLYMAEGMLGVGRMAQVFAEMAKPEGFNINVVVTLADSSWDDMRLKRPVVTSAWSMRPPGEGLAMAYPNAALAAFTVARPSAANLPSSKKAQGQSTP